MNEPIFPTSDSPFTPLTSAETLRLWPLAAHAQHILQRLHYVDYQRAEQDAAVLAAKLRTNLSQHDLENAAFTGIPRGGLIVLGMLAYQLNLRPSQLAPQSAANADLLCIVDDCALSGFRLEQTLSEIDNDRIVTALLYATAGLGTAVQGKYPQVEQFLSAHELAEESRKIGTEADHALADQLGPRLHPGPTELVAFAWNEPDFLVRTPFDEQASANWRFLPPHKCLGNRHALDLPPHDLLKVEWIVPDGIVYGWFDGVLYLLDTGKQEVYRLDGEAAGCWRAAAIYGTTEAVLDFVHSLSGAHSSQQVAATVHRSLQVYCDLGLLQKID